MAGNRARLIVTAIFVALIGGVFLWSLVDENRVAVRKALDQADHDVAAARAAADAAAFSAGEAAGAARRAQSALPGSS